MKAQLPPVSDPMAAIFSRLVTGFSLSLSLSCSSGSSFVIVAISNVCHLMYFHLYRCPTKRIDRKAVLRIFEIITVQDYPQDINCVVLLVYCSLCVCIYNSIYFANLCGITIFCVTFLLSGCTMVH